MTSQLTPRPDTAPAPAGTRDLGGAELAGVEGGVTEGGCVPTLWDLLQQILHLPAPR